MSLIRFRTKRVKDDAEILLKEAAKRLCGAGWGTEEEVVLGRARRP
jgi:hypothetical protein